MTSPPAVVAGFSILCVLLLAWRFVHPVDCRGGDGGDGGDGGGTADGGGAEVGSLLSLHQLHHRIQADGRQHQQLLLCVTVVTPVHHPDRQVVILVTFKVTICHHRAQSC